MEFAGELIDVLMYLLFSLSLQVWDIECGACLRVLEGHDELVRCIRFDTKRIVSGAYDGKINESSFLARSQTLFSLELGKIKIWDLQAALDPRAQTSSLCLNTLTEHTGRVFRLQFDEFQIVSSSHDDTILCFNFLQPESSHTLTHRPSLPCSSSSSPILGVSQTQSNSFIPAVDNERFEGGGAAASNVLQSQVSVRSTSSSSSEK